MQPISLAIIMKHKDTNMKSSSITKMHTLSIMWGLLIIIIIVGLTGIGFVYKEKSKVYKELENTLKEKTLNYVEKNAMYNGSDLKITEDDLIKENIIESLKINDSECQGYVLVKKIREHYEYEPYIKCEKYTTKGYDKN